MAATRGNYDCEGLLFTTRCLLKPSLSCFYLFTIHAEEENKVLYLVYIYVRGRGNVSRFGEGDNRKNVIGGCPGSIIYSPTFHRHN